MRYWITSLLLTLALTATVAQSPMHIAILGDSNTWIGGDDCSKPRGWNKWFLDFMKPATCRSYARSGATWTHTSKTKPDTKENIGILGDNNVIYNQVRRLKEDTDKDRKKIPNLIVILAGTNDVWFQDKRPDALTMTAKQAERIKDSLLYAAPSDVFTLAMAVRYDIAMLRSYYPKAEIVLLTPMQTTAASKEDVRKAGDIIEESGKLLNCHVIRLDADTIINSDAEKKTKRYTSDGTHTNPTGAKHIGNHVAVEVKKILKKKH